MGDAVRVTDREVSAMRRALELAALGPLTGGNPRVGCVLLDAAQNVVAEGWHHGAGTPHAEVDALSRTVAGFGGVAASEPGGNMQRTPHTAVVTLEPCNHTGRTGPCSEALIAAGIRRVVYAVADPGPVSGGGAQRLREAGVEVVGGVLADEAEDFLKAWLTAQRLGRPWVTVKWASTLDGRAVAADGTSQWITGPEARADGHRLRAESDGILTGTGTVLADDPSFTARDADGVLLAHQPVPVVVGARTVPAAARIRQHPAGLVEAGDLPLPALFAALYAQGMRRVLVEAGPRLTSAVIAAGLADELAVYLAPKLLGGPGVALGELGIGSVAEALELELRDVRRLGDDLALTLRAAGPSTPFGRSGTGVLTEERV